MALLLITSLCLAALQPVASQSVPVYNLAYALLFDTASHGYTHFMAAVRNSKSSGVAMCDGDCGPIKKQRTGCAQVPTGDHLHVMQDPRNPHRVLLSDSYSRIWELADVTGRFQD